MMIFFKKKKLLFFRVAFFALKIKYIFINSFLMMYKKIYFLERIISGISGENLATFPCGSVTGSEYPILVDLDNDNESEIVCSCGDSDYIPSGAMKTFQSRFTSWAPSRNIWNQYPYFVANINNDMTIPVQQTHNQVSGNLPFGADNRLNAFLKQAASFRIV